MKKLENKGRKNLPNFDELQLGVEFSPTKEN